MFTVILTGVALTAPPVDLTAPQAPLTPPVAVAPMVVQGDAPTWVGPALTDDIWGALSTHRSLPMLSPRQVRAAASQVGLNWARLASPPMAALLGKQLGVGVLVTGEVRAADKLVAKLRFIDTASGRLIHRALAQAPLEDWHALSKSLSAAVAQPFGVAPFAPSTSSAKAWAAAAEATQVLTEQSLSPAAADPNMPLRIEAAEIEWAKELSLQAAKADKAFLRPQVLLAAIDAFTGDEAGASKKLRALRKKSKGSDPLLPLVEAYVAMRQGRLDEAEGIYRTAIADHPGQLHLRGSLGQLLIRFGRFREARKVFDAYAQLAPRNPWVQTQIGYAEAKMGKASEAVTRTKSAVEMSPDSPFLWVELGSRHLDANDPHQAAEALRTAITLDPTAAVAHVRLGYVHLLRGDDVACIKASEQALEAIGEPKTSRERRDAGYARLNLARAYGHQGDLERALTQLTQAKGLGVDDFAEIESDPKLAALREHPQYNQVID